MGKFKESTTFKIGWMFLLFTGTGILSFGVLVAACPWIVGPYDLGLLRAFGISTAGIGFFGIMVTLVSYRRRERWAWFILWYYPLFWALHLVLDLPPGNDHIHQIVFIVVSLIGLVLPFKQFFPRKTL